MATAVGLSSGSPDSTSSLFLSLSESSPFSSLSSGGSSSLASSNFSASPTENASHVTDDYQLTSCPLQYPQFDFLQSAVQHSCQSDKAWSSNFDPKQLTDQPAIGGISEGTAALFESFTSAGSNFTVRPLMSAGPHTDSLHNRIFERGENYFGFTQEDKQLFMSAVGNDKDTLLLTHFPRRKLDLDLRVLETVYIDDKSRKRQLALEMRTDAAISKIFIRTHALGLTPGEILKPCSKCTAQSTGLFASVLNHSLEGLVYDDVQRQQSSIYVAGSQADCSGSITLTLKYSCCQDHLRNSQRLSQHSLANVLTIIEAYDVMSNLIGRASFRVRIVASPARDMLRLLTNQLTPEQTGCTIGQCAHLAARWKQEKLKSLPVDDLRQCLQRFRIKEELRTELQLQLDTGPVRLAVKRPLPLSLDSNQQQQAQQQQQRQQQQQQLQLSQQEGMQLLDDGSVLVRVSDQRKMARIRQAVCTILNEESPISLQPAARTVPLRLQPILVAADIGLSLRPLFHQ